MSQKGEYTALEVVDEKGSANNDLEEPYNEDFWKKVQEKFGGGKISWIRAMDEVRTDRLIKNNCGNLPKCLLVIIKDWPKSEKYNQRSELVASLEYMALQMTGDYMKIRILMSIIKKLLDNLHLDV